MSNIRIGIVGFGLIGRQHADYLLAGKVRRGELAAICSSSPEKRAACQARGVKVFADAGEMFRSGVVDAVLIATPHYSHPALGRAALAAGLHVLVEKPIAAHKADAELLVAEHQRHPRLKFAAMYQKRAEPGFQTMRTLLANGTLGSIVRTSWITTDWFRTEAYYAAGGWRATWSGEGGGVLLNQALHHLDMLAWLCGQPARVHGFCRLGRFHRIEVEDDATAFLEWNNGATGMLVASTGEAPGTNRLEIVGTRGSIVLEDRRLRLTRNVVDALDFSRSAREGFVKPEARTEEIPFVEIAEPHAAITQNFVNAILDGEPLLAPGGEGILSLELANAVVLSSLTGRAVSLPLDGAVWAEQLKALIARSKIAKTAVDGA